MKTAPNRVFKLGNRHVQLSRSRQSLNVREVPNFHLYVPNRDRTRLECLIMDLDRLRKRTWKLSWGSANAETKYNLSDVDRKLAGFDI